MLSEPSMIEPATQMLDGWRLSGKRYRPLTRDDQGRLWSEELQLSLGVWQGKYGPYVDTWLRLFDRSQTLLSTAPEAQKRVIKDEKRSRLKMQAEIQQLRDRLTALEKFATATDNPGPSSEEQQ